MPSSTSHSRRGQAIPRRALTLLAVAFVTLLAAAAYTLWLNPEIRFYKHAARVKLAWAQKMEKEHGAKVIVFGGSGTAFSVRPELLLQEQGIPAVNLGLHAGMEPPFLTALAVSIARPGDTLIAAFEPDLLTSQFTSPDLAAQIGMALGCPELVHASNLTGEPVHWVEDLLSLRPGAYHCFTLLGKIALRKPLYRYAPAEISASGWQRANDFRDIPDRPLAGSLSPDARKLLLRLKQWGQAHQVKVAFSMPWCYVTPPRVSAFREADIRFLLEVSAILPVLKDPALGIHTVREHYADTEWHLTAEGAALRSTALAAQIKEGRYWTREELTGESAQGSGTSSK